MGCKGFVSYQTVTVNGVQVKGDNYMGGDNGKEVGAGDSS
jgi:hypothetical protein